MSTKGNPGELVYDGRVPEISRFFGIVVFMNYNDHPPPHFHVRYAEQRAIVAIETPMLLEGQLCHERSASSWSGPPPIDTNCSRTGILRGGSSR